MVDIDYQFLWEGTDNPNDLSGVARFRVGVESIAVPMHSLDQALKLNRLIEKACGWSKEKAIQNAAHCVSRALNEQLHGQSSS